MVRSDKIAGMIPGFGQPVWIMILMRRKRYASRLDLMLSR
jgi:hypothetical protein